MSANILLLSSLGEKSGNTSTAKRIYEYIVNYGYKCHIEDPQSFSSSSDFVTYLHQHNIQCILGIHLYKSGILLKDCSVPYIMILGGTDVNKYHTDISALEIMTHVVTNARYLVAFGDSLRKRTYQLWPDVLKEKVVENKQAVITDPSNFCVYKYLKSKGYVQPSSENCDLTLFIIICGIRHVKDPLYLVQTMHYWHTEDKNIYYVIIGPELEEDYFKEFIAAVNRLSGVIYIPGLSISDTHAVIQQAHVLVNSSKSEGMSLAILEAMKLGTPVIARNIGGNRDLIQHNQTGVLYNTPQDFLREAKELISSTEKQQHIISTAKDHVKKHHSSTKEQDVYFNLIKNCLDNI